MLNSIDRKRSLLITAQDRGNHVAILVAGDINTATAPKMEAEIRAIDDQGGKHLTVSLEQVTLVTSAGLRVLLLLTKDFCRNDRMIVWYGSRRNVVEVFKMTGFDGILMLADSYETALEMVTPSRAVCAPGEEVFVAASSIH